MKIVIDSNRFMAALLKDSTTRKILFNNNFEFFAPSFIKSEIFKYKSEFMLKTGLTKEDFDKLLDLLFEKVNIIYSEEYSNVVNEEETIIKDRKDFPYLALCIYLNAKGIWTHDPHFKDQKICKMLTNIDMLNLSR